MKKGNKRLGRPPKSAPGINIAHVFGLIEKYIYLKGERRLGPKQLNPTKEKERKEKQK